MKVLSSRRDAKNHYRDGQIAKRRGHIYVIGKSCPRFKARQGGAKNRNKGECRDRPGGAGRCTNHRRRQRPGPGAQGVARGVRGIVSPRPAR
ncbi:50S ribosomal protein L36 [Pseudomonas sp. MSSRFD41]|nr:50S ribosomal protein L36 [Pseudomonas sp. MSSRFD41]